MAVFLLVSLLLLGAAAGSYLRHPRDIGGPSAGSGAGAFSGASSSSSSFSSSSGTKVAPAPGGYGNFNAFAGNFGPPPQYGAGAQSLFSGGASGGNNSPFGFPGFTPFVPQYGQQYPYTPFPAFTPSFDFSSFLNQYFQAMQNFQAQAQAHAQQAANSGHGVVNSGPGYSVWAFHYPRSPLFALAGGGMPVDTNDVGGFATATYSPQGGYGSANVFPAPGGGLESRFGGDEGAGNSMGGGGPVSSVSGNFPPPGGSSYGVFTSSVSGSSDINGKKTSFKQSSVGINDNGKVTTYTAHDP